MDVAVCGRIFFVPVRCLDSGIYAGVGTLGSVVVRASSRRRIACLVTVLPGECKYFEAERLSWESDELREIALRARVRSLQWRTSAISVNSTVVICGGRVVRRYAMPWLLKDKFAELH